MDSIKFDYSKLRGKIVEVCGSICNFSREMNITDAAVGNMLAGKTCWTSAKIIKACKILRVNDKQELCDLFFCTKSMEN